MESNERNIKIFVNTQEEKKKVEDHLKQWLSENFKNKSFTIDIEEEQHGNKNESR